MDDTIEFLRNGINDLFRQVGWDMENGKTDHIDKLNSPIRNLRIKLGLEVKELSELMGIKSVNLMDFEEMRKNPTLETLIKLKKIARDRGLEVSLDDLVGERSS